MDAMKAARHLVKVSSSFGVFCLFCAGLTMAGCRPAARDSNTIETGLPPVSPQVVATSVDIGSKVNAALMSEPRLKKQGIIVMVSNLDGGVQLSGRVEDADQEKLALKLAQKAAKGRKVVSRLTIKNSLQKDRSSKMPALKPASGKTAAGKSANPASGR